MRLRRMMVPCRIVNYPDPPARPHIRTEEERRLGTTTWTDRAPYSGTLPNDSSPPAPESVGPACVTTPTQAAQLLSKQQVRPAEPEIAESPERGFVRIRSPKCDR